MAACSSSILPAGNAASVSPGKDAITSATVELIHQPTGSVQLSWNPNTSVLAVTLHMTGLTPLSSHPAYIHQAFSCQIGGPVLFALYPVVADAAGIGTSTTLMNIANGIPRAGWIINVHNGPSLTPAAQFLPIACVAIHNYARVHGLLVLRYPLDPTAAADQHASGQAWLSVAHHQLIVKVVLHGLVPGSIHMEHIHLGSCAHQGQVVYMLQQVVRVTIFFEQHLMFYLSGRPFWERAGARWKYTPALLKEQQILVLSLTMRHLFLFEWVEDGLPLPMIETTLTSNEMRLELTRFWKCKGIMIVPHILSSSLLRYFSDPGPQPPTS